MNLAEMAPQANAQADAQTTHFVYHAHIEQPPKFDGSGNAAIFWTIVTLYFGNMKMPEEQILQSMDMFLEGGCSTETLT